MKILGWDVKSDNNYYDRLEGAKLISKYIEDGGYVLPYLDGVNTVDTHPDGEHLVITKTPTSGLSRPPIIANGTHGYGQGGLHCAACNRIMGHWEFTRNAKGEGDRYVYICPTCVENKQHVFLCHHSDRWYIRRYHESFKAKVPNERSLVDVAMSYKHLYSTCSIDGNLWRRTQLIGPLSDGTYVNKPWAEKHLAINTVDGNYYKVEELVYVPLLGAVTEAQAIKRGAVYDQNTGKWKLSKRTLQASENTLSKWFGSYAITHEPDRRRYLIEGELA